MDDRTYPLGLARVSFGFVLGAALYRCRGLLQPIGRAPHAAAGLCLVMLIVMAAPVAGSAWDMVCSLLVLPAIVAVGAVQDGLGRAGRLLGDLSYPVYAIHYPLLILASHVRNILPFHVKTEIYYAFTMIGIAAAAWLAAKLYDQPARAFLSGLRVLAPRALLAGDGSS